MEKSSENGSLHEIRTQRKCLRLQYTVCFDFPGLYYFAKRNETKRNETKSFWPPLIS